MDCEIWTQCQWMPTDSQMQPKASGSPKMQNQNLVARCTLNQTKNRPLDWELLHVMQLAELQTWQMGWLSWLAVCYSCLVTWLVASLASWSALSPLSLSWGTVHTCWTLEFCATGPSAHSHCWVSCQSSGAKSKVTGQLDPLLLVCECALNNINNMWMVRNKHRTEKQGYKEYVSGDKTIMGMEGYIAMAVVTGRVASLNQDPPA